MLAGSWVTYPWLEAIGWVLKESHTQVCTWRDPPGLQGLWRSWGAVTDGVPFSSQTSQQSCKDEPGALSSQNFLEKEEDSGLLSQQQQAASSTGSEPISNSGRSHGPLVNLEYLPFFRTYGQLLTEESALQPEVGKDRGGAWSTREAPSWEDSEPPGGLSPYYRSKEENFPRLSSRAFQDPPTRREAWAGCFHRTVSGSSVSAQGPARSHRRVWGAALGPWPPSDPCPRAQAPRSQASAPPPGSARAPGAAWPWLR